MVQRWRFCLHSFAGSFSGGMFHQISIMIQQKLQCLNFTHAPSRLGEPYCSGACKACGSKNLCIFSGFVFFHFFNKYLEASKSIRTAFGSTYDHFILALHLYRTTSTGNEAPQSMPQLPGELLGPVPLSNVRPVKISPSVSTLPHYSSRSSCFFLLLPPPSNDLGQIGTRIPVREASGTLHLSPHCCRKKCLKI